MNIIKTLSRPRFEALLYKRRPLFHAIAREIEWWTIEDESLIATIFFDLTDKDYGFTVLGRDETGVYRGVHTNCSYESVDAARNATQVAIEKLSENGDQEFAQDDNKSRKHEILIPCVPEDKLHGSFKVLASSEGYSPAHGIIKELSFAFTDLDGNYRKDFQTTGFDGRLWELYLYATFYELRFVIEDKHAVPDFIIEGPTGRIGIEAVTVNSTTGTTPPDASSPKKIAELCHDYMPIKWGSPLITKLGKRYWEKEQIAGIPLVFAIHDFHAQGSMTWSMPALSDYLYGIRCDEDGKDQRVDFYNWKNKKNIPAGFFRLPDSENVSAILASNQGTLTKFNRIGKIAGFGNSDIIIKRQGVYMDLENNGFNRFIAETEVGKVDESWSSGLWIFHNPKAKIPLDPDAFPNALHVFLDDNNQRNYSSMQTHHVVTSVTHIIAPEATPESSATKSK